MIDFKTSLCVFPFFVLVWFNSENRDNLLDKVFLSIDTSSILASLSDRNSGLDGLFTKLLL